MVQAMKDHDNSCWCVSTDMFVQIGSSYHSHAYQVYTMSIWIEIEWNE